MHPYARTVARQEQDSQTRGETRWLPIKSPGFTERAEQTLSQGLDTFVNLRILSIQSNRITKLEGLEALANLEELYISHNGLTKIEGLERNVSCRSCEGLYPADLGHSNRST
jgi:Leucine-rich repeat (LRR) protein